MASSVSGKWCLCYVLPAANQEMKGIISLSLAEELRAIRGGDNSQVLTKQAQDNADRAAPWKEEVERLQQTLQEVLQAVSQFSGVELPGSSPTSPDGSDSLPRLDCNTLKNRIRNDLEAFSVRTAAEVSRQAEEHARAAMGSLQIELSSRVEEVASELREKMRGGLGTEQVEIDIAQQSKDRVADVIKSQTDEFARWVWLTCKGTETPTPLQIERLLEPYVEEATTNFAASFRKNVQELIAGQEQGLQEKLQAVEQSVQGHLSSLEQAALQVCERNADSVAKQFTDRMTATADEAVKGFEGRIGAELEGAFGRFQAQMVEASAANEANLQRDEALRAENFKQRLDETVREAQGTSLSAISSHIAHTSADLVESSVQHLHQQTVDSMEHSEEEISAFMKLQMEEVRQQIRDLSQMAHQSLDRELSAASERQIGASREDLTGMIQGSMESMEERVRQIAEQQLQEVTRLLQVPQEAAASQYSARLQEAGDKQFNGLMERLQQQADQAGLRVVEELKAASEPVVRELSEKASASAAALKEEAAQAVGRIEMSVRQSLETYRQQLAQITQAGIEQQQSAAARNIAELHSRLRRAAELLTEGDPNAQ
jgi:hypothetical protein